MAIIVSYNVPAVTGIAILDKNSKIEYYLLEKKNGKINSKNY